MQPQQLTIEPMDKMDKMMSVLPVYHKDIQIVFGYVVDQAWLDAMKAEHNRDSHPRMINYTVLLTQLALKSGCRVEDLDLDDCFDFKAMDGYVPWDEFEDWCESGEVKGVTVLSMMRRPKDEVDVYKKLELEHWPPQWKKLRELVWRDGMAEPDWYQYAWQAELCADALGDKATLRTYMRPPSPAATPVHAE